MKSAAIVCFSLFAVLLLGACPSVVEAAADPVVVEVHYQNGIKFFNRGLYPKAVREFEKTLALDPGHQEARDYLAKAKGEAENKKTPVVRKGQNEEVASLQRQGEELYRRRDYEGALAVFDKAIAIDPLDPQASLYREKCEAEFLRQNLREKKKEDAATLKARAKQERLDKVERAQAEKAERREVLKKRAEINQERRHAGKEKEKSGAREMKRELALEEKRQKAEERRLAAERAREDKLRRKEERQAARDEARREKEERRQAPQSEPKPEAPAAEVAAPRAESEGDPKALFLQGVDEYGRRNFSAAIATFGAVLETEAAQGKKVYSGSAQRLMDKAKKRAEGTVASPDEVSDGS